MNRFTLEVSITLLPSMSPTTKLKIEKSYFATLQKQVQPFITYLLSIQILNLVPLPAAFRSQHSE